MKKSTMEMEVAMEVTDQPVPPTQMSVPEPSIKRKTVVLGSNPPPSSRQLQQAIDALIALKAADTEVVGEGEYGDVFLVYDLSLRSKGKTPMRIHGQHPMHGILLATGYPDASIAIDRTLDAIVRPMRAYANTMVAAAMSSLNPAPSSQRSAIGMKRLTTD